MHTPFIGAYWGIRKEPKEKCAHRVAELFERLRSTPDFAQWFTKGKSVKAAAKIPIPLTAEGIVHCLKSNNRDTDGSAIAELGFNLNLWNCGSSSISITCGAFSSVVRNSVVLNLPMAHELKVDDHKRMRTQMDIIIEVWDPDQAVITSFQLMSEKEGGMPWLTKGWFNYSKDEGVWWEHLQV